MNVKRLRILTNPHKSLRSKTEPIEQITEEVKSVIDRMFQLMRISRGIGLAAPQIGLPWRMFVSDTPQTGPVVFINPVISSPFGVPEIDIEGCLSLPGWRCKVSRSPIVTISGLDINGQEIATFGNGISARCWQHEVDHLSGILIIDKCIGHPWKSR